MLINEQLIMLDLPATTKEEAIELLSQRAKEVGRVSDATGYKEAVIAREEQYSTGVGFGVAIPHGKTDAVSEPFLMFATVDALDWASLDGTTVDLIFAIGVPEQDSSTLHLKILSKLSRQLMKEDFRDNLRKMKDPADIIQLLKDSDLGI